MTQNITANGLETVLPKSIIVPCNLACAKMPSKGMPIAVMTKPNATKYQLEPAKKPSIGGSTMFPTPKKSANKAKPTIKSSLRNPILKLNFAKDRK